MGVRRGNPPAAAELASPPRPFHMSHEEMPASRLMASGVRLLQRTRLGGVNLSAGSAMFLTWGWKPFARSRSLGPGHLLHFKFERSGTLFVKIFGVSGIRLECYAESSSGLDYDSCSDSGDDGSTFAIKQEDSD